MNTILIVGSLASSLHDFRGALIKKLSKSGHVVHAAAPGLLADASTCSWLQAQGVQCHDISLSRTGLRPTADLRSLVSLYRVMRRVRPDVSLCYTIKPVIYGGIAAWLARVPRRVALITGLGYAFTGEARGKRALIQKLARRLYATALRHMTLVFFQNPDDLSDFNQWDLLQANIPTKVVNGSGVDIDAFSPAPFPDQPIRFLLIARLLGDKGIHEYATAARHLRKSGANAEFHLVGPLDSNPDAIAENTLTQWHEAGILHWHGALADVRSAIAESHVYVLPSYREGTPRTVLEAMSMGRAIITTDAPGCRETVENGLNGFLVPVRDSNTLIEAMSRFINDPDLVIQMGAEARRLAVEKYDVHKVNAVMMKAMGLSEPSRPV
ncbi:MAG: glycosyltransferase family 4 protein [Litorimonas sp.]